jgi:hypothetical protein
LEDTTITEERFGLEDEEFWSDPWRTKKAVQRKLMAQGKEAFVIAAPAKVGLDAHRVFPVAVIRVYPVGGDNPNFEASTIVTGMNLYTGELRAALAFDPPAAPRPRPHPNGLPPAMIGEGRIVDLAQRLKLPPMRGDFLITFISLDQVSERQRMKVVETVAYEDPAVEEFFGQRLATQLGPPKVSPEAHSGARWFPIYEQRLDSPSVPSESGIQIVIERVNLVSAEECILTASFKLPVDKRHIVAKARETAIVPITLLLTGSVDRSPQFVKLHVPSYAPITSEGGQNFATGHFTLDLCQMANLRTTPQTYFIYAFAGSILTGPIPSAFVALPPSEARSANG